jgi:hypothetical protein
MKQGALALGVLCACNAELKGEVDGQKFVRCAQVKPPSERTLRSGALSMSIHGRTLQIDGPTPLRIAAFTGPVGRAFTPEDLAQLRADELALWLGGLGDTQALANENLTRIAQRKLPVLFVAGGDDRWPLVEAAFESLPADSSVLQGSGLRTIEAAGQRLAIAPGAALGRYAIDEQGCGTTPEDAPPTEGLLIAWQALPGRDGLFAFPAPRDAEDRATVPRLGAPGTQRRDGARLKSQVGHWELGPAGLRPRP